MTTADGEPIELEPFHRIHDARYRLSWPLVDDTITTAERQRELVDLDAASTALEARVVDAVAFGEQQPEIDHQVVADNAARGTTATGDRWLQPHEQVSAVLRDWQSVARVVRVEWVGDDDDTETDIRLLADGEELEVHMEDGPSCEASFESNGRIQTTIVVSSHEGSPIPRLRRVLLLAEAADHAISTGDDVIAT